MSKTKKKNNSNRIIQIGVFIFIMYVVASDFNRNNDIATQQKVKVSVVETENNNNKNTVVRINEKDTSGVIINDITSGKGDIVQCGNNVIVKYTVFLEDGSVFYNTEKPLSLVIGNGSGIIKGVERGVSGMKKGGIRKVIVPVKIMNLQKEEKFGNSKSIGFRIELIDYNKNLHNTKNCILKSEWIR